MIIVLKQDAPDAQVREFCHELQDMGLQINDSKGSDTHILGLIGDTKAIAESWVLANPVVETCRRVSEPYKKANRKFHPRRQRDRCQWSEDRRRQLRRHCRPLQHRERGADHLLRPARQGCRRFPAARRRVQAPHLPPYSFQGMRSEGLDLLKLARRATRLPHRHRDHEHRAPAPLRECRPHPGGCPQYAEL